ncbi:peroxiredoxin [Bombilactobacillus thymidiniphilus]|uniref:Peroxiredoxin n=1 Tax=Bombilactobacillus thymidiniphilus TaxID=2923363 RepID=A0ABY4PCG5_9LACO|nr:peroxiredoxin [Bombilactobacillus thymidiniphilus]UQS83206.1 peroxiredoxin [Bombilactobacillus thymidiniphilus]
MDITRKGEKFCTITNYPKVGQKMADFTVINDQNQEVELAKLLDRPLLISVVPDINTSVCSLQTQHFNKEMDNYNGINFVTISTNSVAQQQNWCAAEGVQKMRLLSDEKLDFGKQTNLLMADSGLLARSVWILDPSGTIIYSEIMSEMTDEPNYSKALDQLNQN